MRRWAADNGDDIAGVEALLAHPALNATINGAIALSSTGERLSDDEFDVHVQEVYIVHNQQTNASRAALRMRWSAGGTLLLGRVPAWDLLRILHFTVDNTDHHLMYTSRAHPCAGARAHPLCFRPNETPHRLSPLGLTTCRHPACVGAELIHCLQVFNMIREDATVDPRFERPPDDPDYLDDMLVAALVHDLGKSLSLFGEADGNVDCMNRITAYYADGLDNVEFQYNHDQFGHDKLLHNVQSGLLALPGRVLDVVRLHSLRELGGVEVARAHGGLGSVHMEEMLRLVDGDIVSPEEQQIFNAHVTSETDSHRVAFVQHFGKYDYNSKDRTDIFPDVDMSEVKRILSKYARDPLNPVVDW